MQAIILAAGMGKRLGKHTRDCTKCMVSVAGIPLIKRSIEALKTAGIRKTIIVVGYQSEKLVKYLQENTSGMDYEFVYNKDFRDTNNIYSLFLAKEHLMKDDTILMESDLIYDSEIIINLLEAENKNMVTVAKYEQWMDGTVVLLDKEKNIIEFVEKTEFEYQYADNYYKTVNIYKFSKEFSENLYIPFLEAYIKAYGKNQYYELVLKVLAHVQYSKMKALIVEEQNWYEIDNVQDLEIANTIFANPAKQFHAYDKQFGGFWRFPKLKDFCYLVNPYYPPVKMVEHMKYFYDVLLREYPSGLRIQNQNAGRLLGVDERFLLVGNGAAELIKVLGEIIEGRLTIHMPAFNEYVRCFSKCQLQEIRSRDYDFQINEEALSDRINGTDSMVIVNPDNPSGSFLEYSHLIHIISECKKKEVICIIDESFIDFADKDIRYTLLQDDLLKEYDNLIVIKSISKSYGVPGLRLGIMASSNEKVLDAVRHKLPIWNINSFAEYFLQIHDLYHEDYINACNKIAYQRNRLEEQLKQLDGIAVFPSQANYIMCRIENGVSCKEVANELVEKWHILIKDLSEKDGIEGEQYIRVAVKNQEENDLLIEALSKVLQRKGIPQ